MNCKLQIGIGIVIVIIVLQYPAQSAASSTKRNSNVMWKIEKQTGKMANGKLKNENAGRTVGHESMENAPQPPPSTLPTMMM